MSYEITVDNLEPVAIASVRREIDQGQIGEWIDQACERIFPALGAAGLQPTGPMYCRYHTWMDDRTDCEIGFPVSGPAPEGLNASSLPGGRNASTVHVGPYDRLPDAYEALSGWMEAEGESPGVGPYEVYLDDPGRTAAEDLRTQVIWPLA